VVNPLEFEERLIPDEQPVIEATLRSNSPTRPAAIWC
jgi:hypothetical protein